MAGEGSHEWLRSLKAKASASATERGQDGPVRYTEGSKKYPATSLIYSIEDLKGLTVEASLEDFKAGTSHILVAKDADILDDDDDGEMRLIASEQTSVPAKVDQSKLSFSHFEEEETEEPKGFVIGDEQLFQAAAERQADTVKRSQFDTNLNSTVEILSSFGSDTAKRKRSSSRKKGLFGDEPVFQPREILVEEDAQMEAEEDFDIGRTLAIVRQKNIETIRQRLQVGADEDGDAQVDEEMPVEGSSLFFTAPSFLPTARKPERLLDQLKGAESVAKSDSQRGHVDIRAVPDRQLAALLNEPLTSSSLGVGRTLELLRRRGAPLVLSDGSRPILREINLAHYDELGNEISAKEAYKHLSHMFHGNKSGKNKEEKRLKRVADRAKAKAGTSGGSELAGKPKRAGKKPGVAAGKKEKPAASRPAAPALSKRPKIFGML